jgi:hypothetical protein
MQRRFHRTFLLGLRSTHDFGFSECQDPRKPDAHQRKHESRWAYLQRCIGTKALI